MGDMITVFQITSNTYDQKVYKFFTYRDNAVTPGSQIKKIYQPFCCSCIRYNFFKSAIAKFGICCLVMCLEYLQKLQIGACELFVFITIVMHLRSYAQTFKDLVFQANIRPFYRYSS